MLEQWQPGSVVEALRCELFPSDLQEAVAFYVRVLGFEVVQDERDAETPYVYLQRGDVRLGLSRRADAADSEWRRPPVGVELVLEVDAVSQERSRVVAADWPLVEDLTDRSWGLTDFRLLDPAGYYWRITNRRRAGA